MIKYIFLALFLVVNTTTTYASNLFYESRNQNWYIRGIPQKEKLNPICSALYTWNDGSEFSLIVDLADGEIYILFINNSWNIADDVNKFYNFRMNVHYDGNIRGYNGEYELVNKSTIRVRNIDKNFVDIFADANELRFVMPGSIVNARVPLVGSRGATDHLVQCIRAFKK